MAGPVELIETRPHKAMVILRSLPNRPGIAAELFTQLGKGGFNVEMISQSGVSGALADISFAVGEEEAERAIEHLKTSSSLTIREYAVVRNMGVLTAYGKALAYEPGIAGRIFFLLADEAINIEMISTGLNSINVLIKESYLAPARNILKKELGLNA